MGRKIKRSTTCDCCAACGDNDECELHGDAPRVVKRLEAAEHGLSQLMCVAESLHDKELYKKAQELWMWVHGHPDFPYGEPDPEHSSRRDPETGSTPEGPEPTAPVQ